MIQRLSIDLKELYDNKHGFPSNKSGFVYLKSFVEDNPETHLFIDEVVVVGNVNVFFQTPLDTIDAIMYISKLNHTKVWLSVRQINLNSDMLEEFMNEMWDEYNVYFPSLRLNLRCTQQITAASHCIPVLINNQAQALDTVPGVPVTRMHTSTALLGKSIVKSLDIFKAKVGNDTMVHPVTIILCMRDNSEVATICPIIHNALLEDGIGEDTFVTYTLVDIERGGSRLEAYLKKPFGILITELSLFTGMESRNCIIAGDHLEKVRDGLLRAVAWASVIDIGDGSIYNHLEGVAINDGVFMGDDNEDIHG